MGTSCSKILCGVSCETTRRKRNRREKQTSSYWRSSKGTEKTGHSLDSGIARAAVSLKQYHAAQQNLQFGLLDNWGSPLFDRKSVNRTEPHRIPSSCPPSNPSSCCCCLWMRCSLSHEVRHANSIGSEKSICTKPTLQTAQFNSFQLDKRQDEHNEG
jgi:hypothetical protein